jgi:hypothetical protein
VSVRIASVLFALGASLGALAVATPAGAAAGPACGQIQATGAQGITALILFARNGSVQRYIVSDPQHNMERDHDFLIALEQRYGPAGLDAPPLKIVSFKAGAGGLMIPERGVDSCGRVLNFQ